MFFCLKRKTETSLKEDVKRVEKRGKEGKREKREKGKVNRGKSVGKLSEVYFMEFTPWN